MGHLAVYIAIDEPRLDELWWQDDGPFRTSFMKLEEDRSLERLDIDKIWDALHCTFTGKSASTPVEGNRLSESIVGVQPKIYDDEDYSLFVSVIENDELPEIISALKAIDEEQLRSMLDPERMKKEKIYPDLIWEDPPDRLTAEMFRTMQSMIVFFQKALSSGNHVLATIL